MLNSLVWIQKVLENDGTEKATNKAEENLNMRKVKVKKLCKIFLT